MQIIRTTQKKCEKKTIRNAKIAMETNISTAAVTDNPKLFLNHVWCRLKAPNILSLTCLPVSDVLPESRLSTCEEVSNVIRRLNMHSSPGPDNIPNRLIIESHDVMLPILTRFF